MHAAANALAHTHLIMQVIRALPTISSVQLTSHLVAGGALMCWVTTSMYEAIEAENGPQSQTLVRVRVGGWEFETASRSSV
jgi:hypothetical protein